MITLNLLFVRQPEFYVLSFKAKYASGFINTVIALEPYLILT